MTVFVALGPHILDVLGRPVTHIPEGQGSALLTELAVTVAGTAGGTAVDLARLGGSVRSVGAIGDDSAGAFLLAQLATVGVDTTGLVRVPGAATSATILPIRPNGERPALHLPGATSMLTAAALDPSALGVDVLAGADFLHVGGPDVLGDFAGRDLPALLRGVRAAGTVVTADLLSVTDASQLPALAPVLTLVDHLLVNDQQAVGLTGAADPTAAALALLGHVPGTVVVTCGADGGVLADAGGTWSFPALEVPVVDTTGCGDAFSAGYLVALSQGRTTREACGLGTCCAALVAQRLGSDGVGSLAAATALLRERWEATTS